MAVYPARCILRSGALRHRISFQEKTQTSDSMGGYTHTWQDSIDAYAAIWPLKAVERLESMKLEHSVTHKIRVRYHSGITADMRIRFGERYFEIIAITNFDERNIQLDILAEESVT